MTDEKDETFVRKYHRMEKLLAWYEDREYLVHRALTFGTPRVRAQLDRWEQDNPRPSGISR